MIATLVQTLVLRPELAGIRLSPEEFDAVEECEENYRNELINGVLIVTPPPLEGERDPNEEMGYWLRSYRDHHPLGAALDKTLHEQTVRTLGNIRRADRVIWAGLGRVPDPAVDLPAVVIEFVSIGKRDWLHEYVEVGVAEYWIIDRFRRTMTVFINQAGGPQQQVIQENETYQTPRLPGL